MALLERESFQNKVEVPNTFKVCRADKTGGQVVAQDKTNGGDLTGLNSTHLHHYPTASSSQSCPHAKLLASPESHPIVAAPASRTNGSQTLEARTQSPPPKPPAGSEDLWAMTMTRSAAGRHEWNNLPKRCRKSFKLQIEYAGR